MKTNLLIITTHDTGRELGCYGRGVNTPHLDALASEGVRFAQAFAASPQCCPSRASFLTGCTPHTHGLIGLVHRGFSLKPNIPTLPRLLGQAGYQTHLFGFQHEAEDPLNLGYQQIHSVPDVHIENVAPLVTEFLQSKPAEPFLAAVGCKEAHRPFPTYDGPVDGIRVPPFLDDTPEIRKDIGALHTSIRKADESIGQILAALDRSGLRERTLVLFTTDHGMAFPKAKSTLFDPGLEIACIARGPGEWSGGKTIKAMIWNLDFLPTFLDYLSIPIPKEIEGVSLMPLLRGETKEVHDQIFPENTFHASYDPMRSVRTKQWKYIRSYEERAYSAPSNVDNGLTKDWYRKNTDLFTRPRPRELLFNLANDPLEQRNVANVKENQTTLVSLRKQLDDWLKKTNDFMPSGQVPIPEGAVITPHDAWEPRPKASPLPNS